MDPYVQSAVCVLLLAPLFLPCSARQAYRHYFGDLHAHTGYSDGDLYGQPSLPQDHFALAKQTGHDFYAVTDHALAKYPDFTPENFEDTKLQADLFTDSSFVAIAGFEYSENDGPGGKGHLNAFNTTSYLDATGATNLPRFYDWLAHDQTSTVAASFNHPNPGSYNGFDYLTDERRRKIAMLEVINSGNLHYDAFLAALDAGWRVAPSAGSDTHGTWRVTRHFYRTGILAQSLTRQNLLDAMLQRRVYSTFDQNLRVTFHANDSIMGSLLHRPSKISVVVDVADPDTAAPNDRITRLELISGGGAIVASLDADGHAVHWETTVDAAGAYLFVRIFAADKTDGATAYSAPVWIVDEDAPNATRAAGSWQLVSRRLAGATPRQSHCLDMRVFDARGRYLFGGSGHSVSAWWKSAPKGVYMLILPRQANVQGNSAHTVSVYR